MRTHACLCVFVTHLMGTTNNTNPKVQVEWRVELNLSPLLCTPTLTPKLKSAVSFSNTNLCYSIPFLSLSFLSLFPSLHFFSFLSFSLCKFTYSCRKLIFSFFFRKILANNQRLKKYLRHNQKFINIVYIFFYIHKFFRPRRKWRRF